MTKLYNERAQRELGVTAGSNAAKHVETVPAYCNKRYNPQSGSEKIFNKFVENNRDRILEVRKAVTALHNAKKTITVETVMDYLKIGLWADPRPVREIMSKLVCAGWLEKRFKMTETKKQLVIWVYTGKRNFCPFLKHKKHPTAQDSAQDKKRPFIDEKKPSAQDEVQLIGEKKHKNIVCKCSTILCTPYAKRLKVNTGLNIIGFDRVKTSCALSCAGQVSNIKKIAIKAKNIFLKNHNPREEELISEIGQKEYDYLNERRCFSCTFKGKKHDIVEKKHLNTSKV